MCTYICANNRDHTKYVSVRNTFILLFFTHSSATLMLSTKNSFLRTVMQIRNFTYFTIGQANFKGIDGSKTLYLEQAVHKTFLQVSWSVIIYNYIIYFKMSSYIKFHGYCPDVHWRSKKINIKYDTKTLIHLYLATLAVFWLKQQCFIFTFMGQWA